MIDWLNNRQQAVDDAQRDTTFTNVNVFCYAEVNRVRDAMVGSASVNLLNRPRIKVQARGR